MQTLLTAFFAAIFSMPHAASPHQAPPPETQTPAAYERMPTRAERLPARNSYADNVCVSCRRTNVSYRVR